MTLIQSWVDSLQLLRPKNLQLFVMVTIKSIIDAYKLYFKYFWWLLLTLPLLFLFFIPNTPIQFSTMHCLCNTLYGLLLLGACFLTRPSILQKNCSYLRTQFKKIILYWLSWNLLLFPLFFISSYSSWYIFFVLFFVDSEGGFKNLFLSMWKALKMVIYNFPLIFVINLCFGLFLLILTPLIQIIFRVSPMPINMYATYANIYSKQIIIGAFLMPIGVCTYANIYIKRLHDQFDLYFPQPQ